MEYSLNRQILSILANEKNNTFALFVSSHSDKFSDNVHDPYRSMLHTNENKENKPTLMINHMDILYNIPYYDGKIAKGELK